MYSLYYHDLEHFLRYVISNTFSHLSGKLKQMPRVGRGRGRVFCHSVESMISFDLDSNSLKILIQSLGILLAGWTYS